MVQEPKGGKSGESGERTSITAMISTPSAKHNTSMERSLALEARKVKRLGNLECVDLRSRNYLLSNCI